MALQMPLLVLAAYMAVASAHVLPRTHGLSAALLGGAGLEHPSDALAVLGKLGLRSVQDLLLVQRDAEEAAELRAELKAAGIVLGDRARLRAHIWQAPVTVDESTIPLPASDDFMLSRLLSHNYGPEWASTYTHRDKDANKNSRAALRALQESTTNESGSISGETTALIVAARDHGEIEG